MLSDAYLGIRLEKGEYLMNIVIGAIILLFGVIAFGEAVSNIPSGADAQFILGYLLPSGAIIVLGVILIAWRKKGNRG